MSAHPLHLLSPHTPEAAAQRLASHVGRGQPLSGRVDAKGFTLRVRQAVPNPFQPVMTGEFTPQGPGTYVKGRIGLSVPARIALVVWLVAAVFLGGGPSVWLATQLFGAHWSAGTVGVAATVIDAIVIAGAIWILWLSFVTRRRQEAILIQVVLAALNARTIDLGDEEDEGPAGSGGPWG
jgi:uncharacterized membrane protein (DUF485 family)